LGTIFYGLAANPPTIAHVSIIQKMVDEYPNDDIVIDIPFTHPWGKKMLPWRGRVDMLVTALEAEGISVNITNDVMKSHRCNVRILNLSTTLTSTYERILYCQLMDFIIHDNRDIKVVIGSDHVGVFDQWKFYDVMLKRFNFLIVDRGPLDEVGEIKYDTLFFNSDYGCEVEWLKLDPEMLDVSSTKIRDAVYTIKSMLPKGVWTRTDIFTLFGVD